MTRTITRRVMLSCLGALSILRPVLLVRTGRSQKGDEIVIVNGWILKKSDLIPD